jgi:hypothetical protein
LSSSTWRNEENSVRARSGITWSTAVTTCESLISRDSDGSGPGRSEEARNQVMTSIATTLTAAPMPASTIRAGRQVILARTTAPTQPSATCPTVADSSTMPTASSDWPAPGCSEETTRGASSRPTTPPTRKPVNASTPATNPCR